MACWFSVADGLSQALVAVGDKDVTDQYWALQAYTGSAGDPIRYTLQAGGTAINVDTSGSITPSTWTHACAVSSASNNHIVYINAGSTGTSSATRAPTGADRISIGTRPSLLLHCNGLIAEVGIWNVALTGAEVVALAAGYSPLCIRPSGLVFYAPLVRTLTQDWKGLTLTNNNGVTVAAHPRVIMPRKTTNRRFTTAAAGGLKIPVAMKTYRQLRIA